MAADIKRWTIKNNWRSGVSIFLDWIFIFFIIYIAKVINSLVFDIVAIWLIGLKQYALGEVFVHEASHNNLFKNKKLNTQLQFLFAYPFLTSVEEYRKYHIPHHTSLGDTNVDPLCDIYKKHGLNKKNPNLFYIWFLRPLLGIYSYEFFMNKIHKKDWENYKYTLIAYGIVICFLFFQGKLTDFLFYWAIPYVWCFPSFYCWQEIEDHYNAQEIARTNTGRIRNWMAHNTGYHFPHHMCPGIPWYNLPQAHVLFFSNSKDVTTGFFDTYQKIRRVLPENKVNKICFDST